ncbi:non-hydrolyzing UDP-N-acetylglucosamine 2-epimerase [Algihabitans albus]|uniref:non-hydrolyzing UDP-N-acetylglucosamine 2-epimerase n=1 Tax=Algihabitans albus TaxID=2164067 RepID=UPI001F33848B|nr:UDP-N-acetylglucosamine 2-epimerase (non-hydrolyzing) [Algihabitans albus]
MNKIFRTGRSFEPALVDLVIAARPNFMKISPLYRALSAAGICRLRLVHTGQHYDDAMSGSFLRELGLPEPDIHLEVGSGSHAQQTAGVMTAYEAACLEERPDWVVVPGDVNSTMACAVTAKKLGLQVIHLEAGLRSFDRSMPEEINRVLTDSIADVFWTPSADADDNLRREGMTESAIVRIGNIMIDTLETMRSRIEAAMAPGEQHEFGLVTLHRPANVDTHEALGEIVSALVKLSRHLKLTFPVHPRTAGRLREFGMMEALDAAPGIEVIAPLGYIDFMARVFRARLVITDSGGLQEETTYLGIPCITLRPNTERPITVSVGTNRLVARSDLIAAAERALSDHTGTGDVPELWDGRTAERAASHLADLLSC